MNVAKKQARKKRLIRIAVIVAMVAVVLTAAVLVLRRQVTLRYGAQASGDIESATVTVGSVSATVSGSGNLVDMDVEDVTLPCSVEVEELLVSAGDKISEGQLLAQLDMNSVLTAMSALQDELDAMDSQLSSASANAVTDTIYATVIGRVKAIYAQTGDSVASVMYDKGALMLLSMDGFMAADVESDALSAEQVVYVETSAGSRYQGLVSEARNGTATVLLTDDGPLNGDSVKIYSLEEQELGTGELYIHEPLSVTGYAGTVTGLYVTENASVYTGCPLFYLSTTGYGANYEALLKDREELEELLQQLVVIYKEGGFYSHVAGSVSSITELETLQAGVEDAAAGDTQALMSVCPDKSMTVSVSVDESDILQLSMGQQATVTVDSIGDDSFDGAVTGIEATGTASNGVTYYAVEITLPKDSRMLPGMTASVVIRIEGVDNALLIPSDALEQTSSSSYVYTSYDETTGELGGMKEVTAGLNNGSSVEITAGLSEGDTVYYTPKQEETRFGMRGDMSGGMPGGGMPGGERPSGMPSGGGGGGMPGFGN